MKINTRARIIIVSILIGLLYILQTLMFVESKDDPALEFQEDVLRGLILGAFLYLGTFWALFFKVRGERLLTIMIFPSIGIIVLSVILQLILVTFITDITQLPLAVISFLVVSLFTYINLLAVNILNTSYIQNIPLAQAAKAAVFIISLLDAFLVFFLLFSNDINIIFRIIIAFVIVVLFSYISLWSIELKNTNKVSISIAIGLLLALLAGALSIWPISAPYLALSLTLVFYVCMNISLEMREIIGTWIWIEYAVIFSLIVILMLFLAEWGINGQIIG